jgi:hypothetical protein
VYTWTFGRAQADLSGFTATADFVTGSGGSTLVGCPMTPTFAPNVGPDINTYNITLDFIYDKISFTFTFNPIAGVSLKNPSPGATTVTSGSPVGPFTLTSLLTTSVNNFYQLSHSLDGIYNITVTRLAPVLHLLAGKATTTTGLSVALGTFSPPWAIGTFTYTLNVPFLYAGLDVCVTRQSNIPINPLVKLNGATTKSASIISDGVQCLPQLAGYTLATSPLNQFTVSSRRMVPTV